MVVLPGARLVGFDERFRFDTFVVGLTTRDAADAARAAAESPGGDPAPLVIAGPRGTGKSHLLGAIARRARELRPHERIAVIAAAGGADDWSVLDGAQLVLVDDAREAVDRERLRDALRAAEHDGARVVLTWADAAGAFDATQDAVAALLRGARVAHLGAPDRDARSEIVRRALVARGLRFATEVVASLAERPVTDVRELFGAVSRLGAAGGLYATVAAPPLAAAPPASDVDFADFLDEVAREVAVHAEPWRLRLGEAAARWSGEGFVVDVIERALRLASAPDVDALLATFGGAVERLRALAAEAREAGVDVATSPPFADPRRVAEAEALVAEARAAAEARQVPNAAPGRAAVALVDAETWVLRWPDVADLLVEEWG